jgi:diguanylate cyclase (GGDEF)-like protein
VAELQVEVERDQREMKHFAAELAVSNRPLHEASVTDPLTGFYNRRYALERLEQEWAASNRSKKPLSCLVIDFDRFKEINDGYGHDVGDKVLAEVAGVLQQNLRTNDVICRMGGDEFLVISPDTDSESMRACALRLLAAVEQSVIDTPRGPVRCGVSIGVATRDAGTATLAMLMKAADEGMYQAKISGRRRIGERFD